MLTVWQKTKVFVGKYWQLLLGAAAVIFLLARQAFLLDQHEDVLENEVETNKKLVEIRTEYNAKIEKAETEAAMAHSDAELEIKKKEVQELKAARDAAITREKDNNSVSGDELADRFGDTFGAEIVEATDENE
jgi:hypothetical protein